jgi:hypothetical protein
MTVRRLIVLAATLLCASALVTGGCGSPDAAVTSATAEVTATSRATVTSATTATDEVSQLYPVRVDGKWGFIDNTGAIRIEPRFAGIRRLDGAGELIGFREGLCAVQLVEDGPWGYIDTSGRVVIEPQFDQALWFSEGLTTVRSAGEYYFVDKTGVKVLGPFRGAMLFSGGVATVFDSDGSSRKIDKDGDPVPDVEVEELGGVRLQVQHDTFSDGLAVAYTIEATEGAPAGLAGYVDESGALVIEPRFDRAGGFSEGLAVAGIGENDDVMRYGYIDKTGAWVIRPQYWDAGSFAEGLARVAVRTVDGVKIGFIDKTGAWVIQDLDDARRFCEGLALVWRNGECGYIDKTGTVVITIPYVIDGWDFSGGVARVGGGFDGAPSYIDKTGTVIWQGE